MQTGNNFTETADIFYFLPFRKGDSVLLIGKEDSRFAASLERYIGRVKVLDDATIGSVRDIGENERFDGILAFLGKRTISGSLLSNLNKTLKPGGNIAFVFKNRYKTRAALARLLKKGVFLKVDSYAIFDSPERPSSIIPLNDAPLFYYFRNTRFPTLRWFKQILLEVLFLLRVHSLAIPAFLVICKKV